MGVTTNLGQTGMTYQYVPNIKAKSGEITALLNLGAAVRLRTFPVLQIMSSLSQTFATDLGGAWAGLPAGLDGAVKSASDGTATVFSTLFQGIGAAGVPIIPVLSVGAIGPYHASVGTCLNRFAPGLVLRTSLKDLPNAAAWLVAQNGPVTVADTDLLIDVGDVAAYDTDLFAGFALNSIQPFMAQHAAWRSVTLVSSSAPKDVGGLMPGNNIVPRMCWRLWQMIAQATPGIHFGDHGTANRSMEEVPGEAMGFATVSPRYALPADWIVRKGVRTSGPNGQPMPAQYHGHAQALVAHPGFGQVPGCWADDRIRQIAAAAGIGRAGNRETWVGFAFNRHASVTCHHLP